MGRKIAGKACPFVSLKWCASMHVCLCAIMLFINPTCSQWLDKWEWFSPQMCASSSAFWCPLLGLFFFFFFTGQRSWAGSTAGNCFFRRTWCKGKQSLKASRVRGSLSHICFMWFEDIRSGTSFLNMLHTDRHSQMSTQLKDTQTTHAPSLSGYRKRTHCLEIEDVCERVFLYCLLCV